MGKDVFVSALIAAAGQGKRMKSDLNKQYLNLQNKPVVAHTLEIFDKCRLIDEIILIIREDEMEYCNKEVINKYKYNKPIKIVAGGKERQESIFNGLKAADDNSSVIIAHDGARPFITEDIIEESIYVALEFKAVGVGVPVKDTIKVVDINNNIINTPNRNTLWQIQTPQTFRYDILMKAHKKALEDNYFGTDDSVLVERIGYNVKMIAGSYENIKITTPEDLLLGEAILRGRQSKKRK